MSAPGRLLVLNSGFSSIKFTPAFVLASAGLALKLVDANARHAPRISAARSRIAPLIIPADAEGVIARHMLAPLRG